MPQCSRCASSDGRITSSGTLCEACALEELLTGEPAAVPETFGRYRVICEIGEGGLGRVYLAEQTEPFRREVALKVVKAAAGGSEALARFETERQALALMNHPHIAD